MTEQRQMVDMLRELGLKRHFRPYREPAGVAILLQVRKPARIVDGRLQGSEIVLMLPATFRPELLPSSNTAYRVGFAIATFRHRPLGPRM